MADVIYELHGNVFMLKNICVKVWGGNSRYGYSHVVPRGSSDHSLQSEQSGPSARVLPETST